MPPASTTAVPVKVGVVSLLTKVATVGCDGAMMSISILRIASGAANPARVDTLAVTSSSVSNAETAETGTTTDHEFDTTVVV